MIEMFIDRKEKQDQLKQFITERNAEDYRILVHALKGDAKTLGAVGLGDLAYEHEKQSNVGNLTYVEAHWDELIECWNRVLEGFKELYRESGREQEAAAATAASVMDESEQTYEVTPEEIAEVISWLDEFETTKAEEKMKEWLLKPINPGQRTLITNALAASENEFDYDKAINILTNH